MSWLDMAREAVATTGLVAVMMLLVELANVASRGALRRLAARRGAATYAASGLLGVAPGCLGSFAVAGLYVHGSTSFGALVTNMIATSGDEAFVMLALFPREALALNFLLLAWGIAIGWLTDRVWPAGAAGCSGCASGLTVHDVEREDTAGMPPGATVERLALALALAALAAALAAGIVGPHEWGATRAALVAVTVLAFALVCVAEGHVVSEHLWKHVVREHVPKVAAWICGVMLVVEALRAVGVPLDVWLRAHPGWAMLAAVVVGVIPQSGPHLVFVTLFAQGAIPFSVLAASSAVQDGHGALPLLAESRREFARLKAVNAAAGLTLGGILLARGW